VRARQPPDNRDFLNRDLDDMARCQCCSASSDRVAEKLGACVECLRRKPEAAGLADAGQRASREEFGLPVNPPQDPQGKLCPICVNECRIAEQGVGYCGLPFAGRKRAIVSWYYDPHPTNCVADWVCPAGTGAGYPEFAYTDGPERGYKNLAVFYGACTMNCLFCQNWHYRSDLKRSRRVGASELADAVDARTSCICYFGGDPTPQLPHALEASRAALDMAEREGRTLRICFETNGTMHPKLAQRMMDLSVRTGGCIKFDLKARTASVHVALTGISNPRPRENFAALAERISERPGPPPLVASTLLVPGYVDAEEVSGIARSIAALDPEIPYRLLAFHPDFYMHDLPVTSRGQAEECLRAAQDAGLTRIRVGNLHLLR